MNNLLLILTYFHTTGWPKRRCVNRSWDRESGCLTTKSWRDFDESWQPDRRNAPQPRRRRTRPGKLWKREKVSSSCWMGSNEISLFMKNVERKTDWHVLEQLWQLVHGQWTVVSMMMNDTVYCSSVIWVGTFSSSFSMLWMLIWSVVFMRLLL